MAKIAAEQQSLAAQRTAFAQLLAAESQQRAGAMAKYASLPFFSLGRIHANMT
jgi:hypothetical protein